MKKLIVILAVTGLLAVGCASRRNQGGVGNENNPSYGTGTTENSGTMENNAGKGAETLKNGINTNTPSSTSPTQNGTVTTPGTGGATTPGGNNSGNGSTQSPDQNTTPTPDAGNTPTNTPPGDSGTQNP